MTVRAYDSGVPVKTADATVMLTITHVNSLPVFQSTPYQVTITEDVANGTSVYKVLATIQDEQGTMTYKLDGIDPAPTYFAVDAHSGHITMTNNLKNDRGLTYTVWLTCYHDTILIYDLHVEHHLGRSMQ